MQDLDKQEAACIAYLRELHLPAMRKAYSHEVLKDEIKRVTVILNEILAKKHKQWEADSLEHRFT
jgi:hypothetical protein